MSDRKISKTSKHLISAKMRIEKEESWCQGTYQKWIDGKYQFCSIGALKQNYPEFRHSALQYTACMRLLTKVMDISPDIYNDTHTHAEVMAKWDEAIAISIQQDQEKGK